MANPTLKTKVQAWSSTKENNVKLTSTFSISSNFVTKAKWLDSLHNTNPVEIFDKMKIDCNACLPERQKLPRTSRLSFPSFPSFLTWSYWLLSKRCISQQCNGLKFFVRKHSNFSAAFLLLHFHKFLCFNLFHDLFLKYLMKTQACKRG